MDNKIDFSEIDMRMASKAIEDFRKENVKSPMEYLPREWSFRTYPFYEVKFFGVTFMVKR